MSEATARCGRISYTNDLPIYAAIDEDVVLFPGILMSGVPAELNQQLLAGQLDISPVSSAFYAEHDDTLVLLSGVCIGALDRVYSVCCLSEPSPKALAGRTIAVTRESVTGRMLFQLICRRYFGFDPVMVESDDPFAQHLADGTPCLLIGDKAIDAAERVPAASVHDVGQLWADLTGLGMVYAVWAARKEYADAAPQQVASVTAALKGSLTWGLENRGAVIARAQRLKPRAAGFYEQYYRALHFDFDMQARAALGAFVDAACEVGLLSHKPALHFFDEVPQHA